MKWRIKEREKRTLFNKRVKINKLYFILFLQFFSSVVFFSDLNESKNENGGKIAEH